ncbi:MAG TPA: hypothetical protein VK459_23470 [Polyangiaceae bacterium]|nr:hypothetical protein [Polyangiaceae bacterium]
MAKLTFAEETEAITGGAVLWQPGPEIGLTDVRLDGLFVIKNPALLASLPWPWPAARSHDEIVHEQKCPATIWTTARRSGPCSGGRPGKCNEWRRRHPGSLAGRGSCRSG